MRSTDEPSIVSWMGWRATWDDLRKAGWEVTRKRGYRRWSDGKVYIRHSGTRMIGRITPSLQPDVQVWELEFLTHERNGRMRPLPVYLDRDLGEEDIEPLLQLVLELQQNRPKRRRKVFDNIVEFRKTVSGHSRA